MKKLLLILTIFCSIFLVACGGLSRIDRLNTRDFFTNEILVIPVGFRYGEPQGESASGFASNMSGEELRDFIKNQSNNETFYVAQDYPNGTVLVKIKNDLQERVALFTQKSSLEQYVKSKYNLNYYYRFFNLAMKPSEPEVEFIFPYHLIEDVRIISDLEGIEVDEPYETQYLIEDYVEFYRMLLDDYDDIIPEADFEFDDNSIRLSGVFLKDFQGKIDHNKAIIISFDNDGGKKTISLHPDED